MTGPGEARSPPLYRQLMGEAFERLSAPIQELHELNGSMRTEGRASVERGANIFARLVAAVMRFPAASPDTTVQVEFERQEGREHWRRRFGDTSFASTQEMGHGRYAGLLVERFGLLGFGLAVSEDQGRLYLAVRRWDILGLPMPMILAPSGDAYEHDADGRFNFHVELALPLVGLVVRYRGWLIKTS